MSTPRAIFITRMFGSWCATEFDLEDITFTTSFDEDGKGRAKVVGRTIPLDRFPADILREIADETDPEDA